MKILDLGGGCAFFVTGDPSPGVYDAEAARSNRPAVPCSGCGAIALVGLLSDAGEEQDCKFCRAGKLTPGNTHLLLVQEAQRAFDASVEALRAARRRVPGNAPQVS